MKSKGAKRDRNDGFFEWQGGAATATAAVVLPGPAKVTLLAMGAAIVRGSTIWKVGGPARTQG